MHEYRNKIIKIDTHTVPNSPTGIQILELSETDFKITMLIKF